MEHQDRLLVMLDPATDQLLDICTGPAGDGSCPRSHEPPYECQGLRVMPVRGTAADGLPYRVQEMRPGRCPLAWIDQI